MLRSTDTINKLTIIFLIIGQSFCFIMARILSGPDFLNKVAENIALLIFSIDISTNTY